MGQPSGFFQFKNCCVTLRRWQHVLREKRLQFMACIEREDTCHILIWAHDHDGAVLMDFAIAEDVAPMA
jgi:hypothetical protein